MPRVGGSVCRTAQGTFVRGGTSSHDILLAHFGPRASRTWDLLPDQLAAESGKPPSCVLGCSQSPQQTVAPRPRRSVLAASQDMLLTSQQLASVDWASAAQPPEASNGGTLWGPLRVPRMVLPSWSLSLVRADLDCILCWSLRYGLAQNACIGSALCVLHT